MFSVIIADDEISIREGLRDFIEWERLNFKVIGVCEDGNKVVDIINSGEQVDLILTDIKMPVMSGISVAKYIQDNNLKTKVVFISGYKEFELAQSAMKYDVRQYILKPLDIDEVTKIINSVSVILEEERLENLMKTSISELEGDFYFELLESNIKNRRYIENMFKLLYPNVKNGFCNFVFAKVEIDDYDNYISIVFKDSINELYKKIQNYFELNNEFIKLKLINKFKSEMVIFGISENENYEANVSIKIVLDDFASIFKLKYNLNTIICFKDLSQLIDNIDNKNASLEILNLTKDKPANEFDFIERVKKYIIDNVDNDISLETISEKFYISQYYFSRVFKARTGETFIDYVIAKKMDKATEMLRNPDYRVYEICEYLNYKNVRYFTKAFKKLTGYTPTEYRAKYYNIRGKI